MNKNIKSLIVLPVIFIIVIAMLAGVNHITAPIIENAAMLREQESLRVVLPGSERFEELSAEGLPKTVTGVYKEVNGLGYAITLETVSQYSKSPLTFTVGISGEGKIVGVEVTNYSETRDFGSYPETFVGKDAALDGVELVGGVTYSATAFKEAVKDAFAALEEVEKQ